MSLTLADVLKAEEVQRANPEILHGAHLLSRPVRWVHTSEIYDIASLLRGGEILIVSGLGLVGASDDAVATYVDRLADRGATALFLELGRTFDRVPHRLLSAAVARDLPLVALHDVVPFVDMTYAVHRLLLRQEAETVVWMEEMDRYINGAMLSGEGLTELLRRVQILADGAIVELRDSSDRPVASIDPTPDAGVEDRQVDAAVLVKNQVWGRVIVGGRATAHRHLLARRAAIAVGILLVHAQSWSNDGRSPSAKLLLDIVSDRFVSPDELDARARNVGFQAGGRAIVGLALTMDSTIAVSAARAAVEALLPRPHLVADLEGEILAAVGVDSADEDEIRLVATRLAQGLERRSSAGGGGRVVALAAGPAVQTLAGLGQSLTAAREARGLTSRLNLQPAVLLSTEIAVYRLLTRFSSDPELERFVSEQIGGLLDHDSKHNTQLLPTLQALAESGWSKSRAARVLGVQRQTIYRRMDHIQDMIAGSIDDAECRAQLSLALKARRVRAVGSVAR